MSNETVILQDSRLDPDRFILEGIDSSNGPEFSVSQFGMIFFARSSHWIRWLEDGNKNVLNGDPKCPHMEEGTKVITDQDPKTGQEVSREVKSKQSWIVDGKCSHCGGVQVGSRKTQTGYRSYNLGEIEEYVHALLASGSINGAQATNALHLVQTIAKIHGLIS